ncbi:hypothetical protein BD626DRAFT_391835 [Schizophyllum amplum]|uniref:Uncharacterized protein n=1 Tax=Schizophyllum amplum TaxID=97359 RepID=A0A550CXE1_9AGAR|nr:hypothetical protein BD626DRAFT_391835 [Auriculariopsis ampla]
MPFRHPNFHCPISGAQTNISRCRLVPQSADDAGEAKVARMEWIWGLPRGGLPYYIMSDDNALFFRNDIARLYFNHEFALVPTLRTYVEIMRFIKHAGVVDRDDKDDSPRRPLTALAPPSGLYRYVFIPFTRAARRLQKELGMQLQTEDDLNGGTHPLFQAPVLPGSDDYPIVECYAHPYSVSTFAVETLELHAYGGSEVIAQWAMCAIYIMRQWTLGRTRIPQSFIDAPEMEWDDVTIRGSERLGYDLPTSPNSLNRTPVDVDEILKLDQSERLPPREKVMRWLPNVIPLTDDELRASRTPRKLRRSDRIKARSSPYAESAPLSPPPRRMASPAARPRCRDVVKEDLPEWVQQNGHFPTRDFSSNDWAIFCRGTYLDTTRLDGRDVEA